MRVIRYLLYSPAQHARPWHALLKPAAAHDAWLPDRSVSGRRVCTLRNLRVVIGANSISPEIALFKVALKAACGVASPVYPSHFFNANFCDLLSLTMSPMRLIDDSRKTDRTCSSESGPSSFLENNNDFAM